ncbi:hypothetical protein MKEN_00942700 [Mycena kentingensis (nom. inval.)]|nr:hypothetical protein MKEN_00942700 [Mycena kentingensis (nom. inval.)]
MSYTTTSSSSTAQSIEASSSSVPRAPLPYVPEMLATIHASSTKLRRLSGIDRLHTRKRSSITALEPENYNAPPVFTLPDYNQPPVEPTRDDISPLTVPQSAPRRATSAATHKSAKSLGKLPVRSVESVVSASTAVTEASSYLSRRRRSSVTSVESFSSNEDKLTLKMRVNALPLSVLGLLASILFVAVVFIAPSLAAPVPQRAAHKCVPVRRSFEREIVLSDEQEQNPPQLRRPSRISRVLRRLSLRRARVAAPIQKSIPTPVVPPSSDIPFVVEDGPLGVVVRPKGPAPVVTPAQSRIQRTLRFKRREQRRLREAGAICEGW